MEIWIFSKNTEFKVGTHTGLVLGVAGVVFLPLGVVLRGVTTSSSSTSSSLPLSGTSSSDELQNTFPVFHYFGLAFKQFKLLSYF